MTAETIHDVGVLARRCQQQIAEGCRAFQQGEPDIGALYLTAAIVSAKEILALTADQRPPRKRPLALVVTAGGDEPAEPDWFGRKANDSPDGAA